MSLYELKITVTKIRDLLKKYRNPARNETTYETEKTLFSITSELELIYGSIVGELKSNHPNHINQINDVANNIEKYYQEYNDEHYEHVKINIIGTIARYAAELTSLGENLEIQKNTGKIVQQTNPESIDSKISLIHNWVKACSTLVPQYTNTINSNWAIAVCHVSLLEAFIKKWLVKNNNYNIKDFKKKDFEELISIMEKSFKQKNISFEQQKLSNIIGKRHFRNKVIHELYQPTDNEIFELIEDNTKFMNYVNSITKNSS